MDTIKNLLIVALLAGVGFGVYRVVTKGEDTPPPGAENAMTEAPPATPIAKPPGEEVSPNEIGFNPNTIPTAPPLHDSANHTAPPSLHSHGAPPVANTINNADVKIPQINNQKSPYAGSVNSKITNPAASLNPQQANRTVNHTTGSFDVALAEAQAMLRQNKVAEAHLKLSSWYDQASLRPQQRQQLIDLLGKLAGTCIYSDRSLLGKQHVVSQGENLQAIAARYKVPWKLIAKINGLTDSAQLTPGTALQVLEGPFHAKVRLTEGWIYVEYQSRYAGRFRIEKAGRDAPLDQIVGNYTIAAKDNQAGEHFISLQGRLGIHSASKYANSGRESIIVNSQDAEDLFDILSVGSKVTVAQ